MTEETTSTQAPKRKPIVQPPTDSTKERIAVLLLVSDLEHGGAQRQVLHLARNLDRDRFSVVLCSLSTVVPLVDGLDDIGVELIVVGKRWRFDVSVVTRVMKIIRARNFSVVHGFLFDAEIVARLAGWWLRSFAVVGSERNADYKRPLRQKVLLRATRSLYDGIIANSEAGRRFTIDTQQADPDRVFVVPNGVDMEQFVPGDRRAARQSLGIEGDGPIVGMVASFKPQKNHMMFLRMAQRLAKANENARFLFAGGRLKEDTGARTIIKSGAGYHGDVDGYQRSIGEAIDAFGLREKCVMLGERKDVVNVYNACDVTVLTSHHEGTPNVLLESMACAVPVVATNVADNAQVVPNGQVGYIVEPDDDESMARRVSALLGDDDLRSSLAKAARIRVRERYATSALAQNTAKVYTELLNKRVRPARSRG